MAEVPVVLGKETEVLAPSSYGSLLKNKNFLLIWFAQMAGQTAYYLSYFLLIPFIFDLTHHNLDVAFLHATFIIPAIVFGAYGGVFSDHHNKRRILSITNFLRAAVILALMLALVNAPLIEIIYLATFTFSIVSQFFIPAETASLAQILPRAELLKASSLFTLTLYGSTLLGISLGSSLYQITGGTTVPLMIATGLFLTAAVLVSFLPAMPAQRVKKTLSRVFEDIVFELKRSLQFVMERPVIRRAINEITISQVILGVMITLAPAFVSRVLGLDPNQVIIVVVPAALGMLAGAVLIGWYAQNRDKLAISRNALLALGLFTEVASLIKPIGALLLAASGGALRQPGSIDFLQFLVIMVLFLIGFSISAVFVPAQTTLQEEADENDRGRVFGILNMIINVMAILPLLLAGALADRYSPTFVIRGFALAVVAVAIFEFLHGHKKRA